MITPAPTSKLASHLARGILDSVIAESATKPAYLVLDIPDTSYKLYLRPTIAPQTLVGKRIVGTIHAKARRVDTVGSGGCYVEPVEGRPRRVQGSVIATDESTNTITVNAGVPIICTVTDERQKAKQFQRGQFVSFDVLDGATFTAEPL